MALSEGVRRYIEAGMAFSQMTRQRAEELVRHLVAGGEIERNRAQDFVEDLVRRSRDTSEALVTLVRGEVQRQLSDLGVEDLDDLARRGADLMSDLPDLARAAARGTARRAGAPSTAKKTTAKKTAPARAAAKKTTAGKTAAKKTTARDTTAAESTGPAGSTRASD